MIFRNWLKHTRYFKISSCERNIKWDQGCFGYYFDYTPVTKGVDYLRKLVEKDSSITIGVDTLTDRQHATIYIKGSRKDLDHFLEVLYSRDVFFKCFKWEEIK